MVEKTRAPTKIPSSSGVTFKGFLDVILPSRELIQDKLEEFLKGAKNQTASTARFLIAEWGEGKTDAFKRYIKPWCKTNKSFTTNITAKQILNSYRVLEKRNLLDSITSDGKILISSILYAIESKTITNPEINDSNLSKFIEETIRKHVKTDLNKMMYVFIDEFEDLFLTDEEFLQFFLIAAKELINENVVFKIGDNENIFSNIHFVICCTPNIFSRIKIDSRFELIWGGIHRRIHEIQLQSISKEEGLKFLFELMKYAYENDLPDILPFKSEGIFNTLYSVSLGNLGTMVQLFSRLLSGALSDGQISIINYESLFKFLEPEKIAIYGGDTQAINIESYKKILDLVNKGLQKYPDSSVDILPLLLGEIKPYTIEEIRERVNYTREITQVINSLKLVFSRENLPQPIIPCVVVKTKGDLRELFKDFLKIEGDHTIIDFGGNQKNSFSEFIDNITMFKLNGGNFEYNYILPYEDTGLQSIFENIDNTSLDIIKKKIERLRNEKRIEFEYVVNPKLLKIVYPTPVPPDLDFISNREKRLKLWREISISYESEFIKIPYHLKNVLQKHTYFKEISEVRINPKNKAYNKHIMLYNLKYTKSVAQIWNYNVLFYSSHEISTKDISIIQEITANNNIHQVFLISSHFLQAEVSNFILDLEFANKFVHIQIPMEIGKKICLLSNVLLDQTVEKDTESLDAFCVKSIDELGIIKKIDDSHQKMTENGWILDDFHLTKVTKSDLVKGYRFFLSSRKPSVSIDDAFTLNRDYLLKFIIFGRGTGLIAADIESNNKLIEVAEDLERNRFGKVLDKTVFSIELNPIEKRILKIVKNYKSIPIKTLQEKFIIVAKSENIIKDYLDILDWRGYIEIKKNEINYIKETEVLKTLTEDMRTDITNIERKAEKNFQSVVNRSQRRDRMFSTNEFVKFINSLHEELDDTGLDIQFRRQIISLLQKYIGYFKSHWQELFLNARNDGNKIKNNIFEKIDEFLQEYKHLINEIQNVLNIDLKRLLKSEEIISVERLKENIETIFKASEEEAVEYYEELTDDEKQEFSFNRYGEFPYFNIKLFKLKTESKNLYDHLEKYSNWIKDIQITDLQKEKKSIQQKLRQTSIPEKNKLCITLKNKLLQASNKIQLPEFKINSVDSFEELKKQWVSIGTDFRISINNLSKHVDNLIDLLKKEEKYFQNKTIVQSIIKSAELLFDTDKTKTDLNKIEEDFQKTCKLYSNALKQLEKLDFQTDNSDRIISQINEDLVTIMDIYRDIPKDLNFIVENELKGLKGFIDEVKIILKRLSKKIDISMPDEYQKLKDEIVHTVNLDGLKWTLSEIQKHKSTSQKALYDQVGKFWDDRRLKVFLTIVSIQDEVSRTPPFNVTKLKEIMDQEGNSFSEKEIEEELDKLSEEGYLRKNYTLLT